MASNPVLVKKLTFLLFGPYNFVKFHWQKVQTISRNVWRDLRFQSQYQHRQHRRVLTANFLQKLIFLSYIYVTIADADMCFNTLFDKYLDHMLVKIEQNRMVGTVQIFQLFDKKWLTIFGKVLKQPNTCNQVKSCIKHGRPNYQS